LKEVAFYQAREDGIPRCEVCPHYCMIKEGERGRCRVRENIDGRLYATNYGRVLSLSLDPIEKKPLYHFYPDTNILSLGTVGCNFDCGFCQNWSLVHSEMEGSYVPPAEMVAKAKEWQGNNNIGLAYTYSEPLMWYEYVLETAELADLAGLKNVLVTNGFINLQPFLTLLPFIHALNIDIKGFTREYYQDICGGRLEPVLKTAELAKKHAHVEITTLLVTDLNDSREEIEQLVHWIYNSLGADTPLHLSRYFPQYKMERPATSLETMEMARDIAQQKLKYVYLGNAWELEGSNTLCPQCGQMVIKRQGFRTVNSLQGEQCPTCGEKIALVVDEKMSIRP